MRATDLFSLAANSLKARTGSVVLAMASIALSTALLIGVEKMRQGARAGFQNTISGVDVIVGARSGSINLLLYSVFRLGDATANVSWETYERFADHPAVAWTAPISLGDSHRGYRVLGTTPDYFANYRFGAGREIRLREGRFLDGAMDVVLGAEVAATLGYDLGDGLKISHGLVSADFAEHDDHEFIVSGILLPTGTPIDRTVHVDLAGLDAMHADWTGGVAPRRALGSQSATDRPAETNADHDSHGGHEGEGDHDDADHADHADHEDDHNHGRNADHDDAHADDHGHGRRDEGEGHDDNPHDHGDREEEHRDDARDEGHEAHGREHEHEHEPTAISAFLVGLKSKSAVLAYQRDANTYREEPLSAIIPGLALRELWRITGVVETTLLAISIFVVAAGLLGMMTAILASLNGRRREIAVLRAAGAAPRDVFALLMLESGLIALLGAIVGAALVAVAVISVQGVAPVFGAPLALPGPGWLDLAVIALVTVAGLVLGAVPGWRAYRQALVDGLTVRV